MPRAAGKPKSEAVTRERQLMWAQAGQYNVPTLRDWDPKQVQLVEALLGILESGATVVLRPGSGGRSVGVAIWEGDFRHAPTWMYEAEEIDTWAESILLRLGADQAEAAD